MLPWYATLSTSPSAEGTEGSSVLITEIDPFDEGFTIINTGSNTVDLNGWRITDNEETVSFGIRMFKTIPEIGRSLPLHYDPLLTRRGPVSIRSFPKMTASQITTESSYLMMMKKDLLFRSSMKMEDAWVNSRSRN